MHDRPMQPRELLNSCMGLHAAWDHRTQANHHASGEATNRSLGNWAVISYTHKIKEAQIIKGR